MEIKVCGMRELENCQQLLAEVHPDWMGLIFYPKSPRLVPMERAEMLKALAVKKVGVFVGEEQEEILRMTTLFGLSALQLHGGESVEEVKRLRAATEVELWKVVSVGEEVDWKTLEGYLPYITRFLFDTATPAHGGSGKKFDWKILETYPFQKEFYLSGGIGEESAEELLALSQKLPQLLGIDLNSGFEQATGLKNIQKLKAFKEKINSQRSAAGGR